MKPTAVRAQELHSYLAERQKDGICPSYQEMCRAIGVISKSVIFRLINHLERDGMVRRLKSRARSIEVLGKPRFVPPGERVREPKPEFPSLVTVPFRKGAIRVPGYALMDVPARAVLIARQADSTDIAIARERGEDLAYGDVLVYADGARVVLIRRYDKPAGG